MMEQSLFILLFFTGVFPLVLSQTRKYYLIKQGKTWTDAQAYCQATHIDLAIIKSNEDMVQLQNEAQKQQFSSSAWIGLYNDINSWRWSMGNEPLGSMRLWASGEPNNGGGVESCGMITPVGWNDALCISLFPFVCFDGTNGNNRYIYFPNSVSWLEAQSYCRQHYTDLASATDATKNSVISGMISGGTWFGLFRDTWKWTDKTNFSTISWLPGTPSNVLGNESCGYLDNSQAVDAQCSDIMPFFCYSLITGQQQIMRIKVQSDQYMNDSDSVMVAILAQIKQKLKDNGMAENITVKWREQPDGEVFHKEKEKEEL